MSVTITFSVAIDRQVQALWSALTPAHSGVNTTIEVHRFTRAIATAMNRSLKLSLTMIVLAGCAQPNEYQKPPDPKVIVAKPLIQTVTDYLEETGTTEAVERVEIRARVDGFLDSIEFEEGGEVEAGQTLYQIQPEEYAAKLAAAQADIAALQAALDLAAADLKREQELESRDATTEANLDLARAKRDAAKASIAAGEAALTQAELEVAYTTVTTPISGRVERTLIKRGNFVSGSPTTHLTTVVKYDPIHVYFSISERSLLNARSAPQLNEQKNERPDLSSIPAAVRRATDVDYIFKGRLDYADLGVDDSTGTFTIRAVFPNPDMQLFPGLFVRIRVPLGTQEGAILVPERALGADQAGRYVMILGDENVVERRTVVVGAKHGTMIVVRDGLNGDELVVIDGLLRARAGATVDPTTVELSPKDAADQRDSVPVPTQDSEPADADSSDAESAADSDAPVEQ